MNSLIQQALAMLGMNGGGQPQPSAAPQMKFSYGPNTHVLGAASPQQSATPVPQASMAPQAQASPMAPAPQAGGMDPNVLKQNIAAVWGQDTPLLNNMDTYMQAGNQLPPTMDKLLPLALALRETQGGKDLINPNKNSKLGKNNVFNMRNDTGAFQDYPDLQTAVLGNLDQGGQSGGLVGLLTGKKDSAKGIYQDFRDSGKYADLFSHWSPPTDKNGNLTEQEQNIQWILNHIRNGKG